MKPGICRVATSPEGQGIGRNATPAPDFGLVASLTINERQGGLWSNTPRFSYKLRSASPNTEKGKTMRRHMRTYHMQPGTHRFMILASTSDRQKALKRGWVKVREASLTKVIPARFVKQLRDSEPGTIYAYRRGEACFGEDTTKEHFWNTGETLEYLPIVPEFRRRPGRCYLAETVLKLTF